MKLLVLLIGGNNIANYALIDYFKKSKEFKFDKVMMIYTSQSENSVKNIMELQKDVEFINLNLENESRNLSTIKEKILTLLKSLNISFIHLNYTGGTKPMSVGAFLAVNELECEKKFSDISPDSSKLTFMSGEIYPQNTSIDKGVNLDIKSLYKLHGIELKSYQKDVSKFYNDEMVKFLFEKSIKAKNYKKFWEFWDYEKGDINKFIEELPIEVDTKEIKTLRQFIRGRWLEEYIFDILKDEDFTDIAWNVEGSIKGRDFELDLVLTKGHKIYMISCTTENEAISRVKQKAFEASIRAEQIGGIRAKPISVSLLDNRKLTELQNDVKNYVGKSNFEFIGRDDLKDRNKLKNLLKSILN